MAVLEDYRDSTGRLLTTRLHLLTGLRLGQTDRILDQCQHGGGYELAHGHRQVDVAHLVSLYLHLAQRSIGERMDLSHHAEVPRFKQRLPSDDAGDEVLAGAGTNDGQRARRERCQWNGPPIVVIDRNKSGAIKLSRKAQVLGHCKRPLHRSHGNGGRSWQRVYPAKHGARGREAASERCNNVKGELTIRVRDEELNRLSCNHIELRAGAFSGDARHADRPFCRCKNRGAASTLHVPHNQLDLHGFDVDLCLNAFTAILDAKCSAKSYAIRVPPIRIARQHQVGRLEGE
eukprot:scaffold12594_cov129-Isochrysis_galbana.AAC.3